MERRNARLVHRGWLGVLVSSLSVLTLAQLAGHVSTTPTGVSDRLIVVFRSETLVADAGAIVKTAGGRVATEIPQIGVVVVEADDGDGTQLRQRLLQEPAILDVGSDWVVSGGPDAAMSPGQDAGLAPGSHWPHPLPTFSPVLPPDFFYTSSPQQWSVKRVGAAGGGVPSPPGDATAGAWDTTFGSGVKIAILDTGISTLHPDLAGKVGVHACGVASLADPGRHRVRSG